MTMETPPFEDVFPIENGDFPIFQCPRCSNNESPRCLAKNDAQVILIQGPAVWIPGGRCVCFFTVKISRKQLGGMDDVGSQFIGWVNIVCDFCDICYL